MKKPKVSIIIVQYHSEKVLLKCLRSIQNSKIKVSYEAIVVDNDERKKIGPSLKGRFPWVRYVKSPGDIGYGAGNNLGAKYAKGEYLFILNPDTKVFPGTIDKLVDFLEKNKSAAVVAPNLVDEDGVAYARIGSRTLTPLRGLVSLSFFNTLFPNNPVSNNYWMKNINPERVRQVDVAPGAALVIRKEVFESLNGFDENFFLYFEESDFCKRVKETGWQIFIIPGVKVLHSWGQGGTNLTEETNKIFAKSRFYYFRKHYGIVNALMVEAFAGFSKWHAALFAILCLAAFLRLWQIGTLMQFIGDFGWYYLSAKDFLLKGNIPLLGIASSVPVLRQGAIFTWMLAGALFLGNFNPVSGAYLTALLGILAVWGTYGLATHWFGRRIGLISAALAATSPFIVVHDRMPFVTAGIFPLTLVIAWLAKRSIGQHKHAPLLLGFFMAVLYQFELAGFILLPIVVLALLWQKVKPKWKSILRFALGGTIGLTPFIFSDIREGTYLQTAGFGFWLIRKSVRGFFSFLKGGADTQIFTPGVNFLTDFTFPLSKAVALTIFVSGLILIAYWLIKERKSLVFAKKLIIVWLSLATVGFFLKGVFAEAYMPTVFFPTLMLLAFLFDFLIAKFRYLGWAILLLIVGINSLFVVKVSFNRENMYSISKMNEVAKYIVAEAEGRSYQLVYMGPSDMYESGDNAWRYLLWREGNEPEIRSNLVYTISYEPVRNLGSFDKTINFGSITVGVKQK